MALKPNTIKALFGKLAPLADDAVGAVAKYGDDVARAVMPYADDVADDTARLLKYMNGQYSWSGYPYHRYQSKLPVRNALSAIEYYDRGIPTMVLPNDGVMKKAYDYVATATPDSPRHTELFNLLFNATDSAPIVGTNYTAPDVSTLGHSAMKFDQYTGDVTKVQPLLGSVKLPSSIPANQLVVESPSFIRPHKNTALGRWFAKQHPDWSQFEDIPFEEIPLDAILPF